MNQDFFLQLPTSQRRLLEIIRAHRGSSRAELAAESGLTSGAVTRHVKELLLMALISEGERRSGMRGQPALPLSILNDAAYSIGLSFALDSIQAVVIDFAGEEIDSTTQVFDGTSAKQLVSQAANLVKKLAGSPTLQGKRILGVGIALPGYFTSKSSIVMDIVEPLSVLQGQDLRLFKEAFERETWIENNSSASALAEYYRRPDTNTHNLVLVNIGYGLSSGIVLDGKLYRGYAGNAGEIGRIYPRGTPRPSSLDLLTTLQQAGRRVETIDDIDACIEENDPLITKWVTRASAQLRYITEIISVTIAPDEIILGGTLPSRLIKTILTEIESESGVIEPRYIKRRASTLGPRSAAMGAAFLPIYQTCSPNPDIPRQVIGHRFVSKS